MLRFATGHGLGPRRHWYQWFGIEPPFPWVLLAVYAIPVLLIAGAVVAGMVLA